MSDEKKPRPRLVKRAGLTVPFATRPVGDVPALTGTVEVLSAGQWEDHLADFRERTRSGVPAATVSAEFHARHLKTWDFFGEATALSPLPITPANVLALPPCVFEQLDEIVRGTVGTVSGNG